MQHRMPALVAAVSVAVLTTAAPAAAAPLRYEIVATTTDPLNYGDFSLIFDDLDGDTMFSIDELVTFSGVTLPSYGNTFFPDLLFPALVLGFTDGPGASGSYWGFGHPTQSAATVQPGNFDLTRTLVAAPDSPSIVPLPPALLMLVAALGGLAALRRRRSSPGGPLAC